MSKETGESATYKTTAKKQLRFKESVEINRASSQQDDSFVGSFEHQKLLLAAAYVSDAQFSRNIPFETSPHAVRLYYLYNHWMTQAVTYFFIILNLALAVFEDPAVYALPVWATSIVEAACLLAFTGRLVHFAKVTPKDRFWKDRKNICVVVAILAVLVDLIIYGTMHTLGHSGVRYSRILRPIFLVNFAESRQIRRAFRSIRNTLPEIMYVFLLFMFTVLMFSLLGMKLFKKRNLVTIDGKQYFKDYLDALFDMYVLVTTANSPDVMMPAYDINGWYSIFFLVYIIINTYIFMSVFLAVVYNNYRKQLKNEIKKLVYMKRHKMTQAFHILKVEEGTKSVIKNSHWRELMNVVAPDISCSHRELLLRILDEEQKGYMVKESFLRMADLLNIKVITMKSRIHSLELWIPRIYNSSGSLLIRRIVQHKGFVYCFDVIIFINAIFIGMEDEYVLISYVEWGFLALYITEILLKLYTYDPRTFFARTQFWNWFDTLVIIAALLATVVNATLKSLSQYNSQEVLDIVFILRVLRLIRIVDSIQRFRVIINTLLNIMPTMLTFAGLLFVVYYVFAIFGMEVFKDRIHFYGPNSTDPAAKYCGSTALNNSVFANLGYCKNNFNNIISSFIVLVELTVVNQWHVITIGFEMVTHPASRIYFFVFHIVVVILIINIFIAFILEAFFVEYSLDRSEVETTIEKKIQEQGVGIPEEELTKGSLVEDMETSENDLANTDEPGIRPRGLKFRIASKRYKTVDALLQHMFESELDPEDDGPPLDTILEMSDEDIYISNPTFDSAA
ncbi:two pore calcium channel protein 1-like [Protopterus annectens]|uniref:two pore calcium channel protein 1-like n=1 Tax=Protopterus annectens TaxID=7888 RepID=UPI001CFA6EDD|nr:two pore calcium channel protein 1-like [Protopterus annectens]